MNCMIRLISEKEFQEEKRKEELERGKEFFDLCEDVIVEIYNIDKREFKTKSRKRPYPECRAILFKIFNSEYEGVISQEIFSKWHRIDYDRSDVSAAKRRYDDFFTTDKEFRLKNDLVINELIRREKINNKILEMI